MNKIDECIYDVALGSLLGACIGDAAGATLEFIGHKPNEDEVADAIGLNGGGIRALAPGQITDDGELSICLAQALASSKNFDLEIIAQHYANWIRSKPFDVGFTTHRSIGCFENRKWADVVKRQGYARAMQKAAEKECLESMANGSLMRATPLAIWGYKLTDIELAKYAHQDSSLSHPNINCRDAVACYVIAISSLLNNIGDYRLAFSRAFDWAQQYSKDEVLDWLKAAAANYQMAYYPQAGFIKIAFIHAFRHLYLGTNFIDALRETLLGGGDTDTNSCIIEGLIGALWGANAIDKELKDRVLQCDTQLSRYPRPAFLHPSRIPMMVTDLLLR